MFKDWDFWLSVITAATAVVALILTFLQIRISNKQSLFDRRLAVFIKIDGIVKLYTENIVLLQPSKDNNPIFSVDYVFACLTNNSYLEEVGGVIQTPLKNPLHKQFLKKLEDIKQLAVEAELVFNRKNASKVVCSFVTDYERLLFSMYQYQILLNNMKEYSKDFQATLEDSQKGVREPEHRKSLLSAYDAIKNSYELIVQSNALEQLKNQIKL